MGFDVELHALPPQCRLLEQVRAGEISAELLPFVGAYFRVPIFAERFALRGYPEAERFVKSLEEIRAEHPGIAERSCYLDRRFDWLRWLLVRCAGADGSLARLGVVAVRGDAQIFPDAVSGQGFPIRWTLPDHCMRIHRWLDSLTIRELHAQYDPVAMELDNVHKWWVPDDPDGFFEAIAQHFVALQRLYREVAIHSEAVLVTTD